MSGLLWILPCPFLPASQRPLSHVLLAPHNQIQLWLLCSPQANYTVILLTIVYANVTNV